MTSAALETASRPFFIAKGASPRNPIVAIVPPRKRETESDNPSEIKRFITPIAPSDERLTAPSTEVPELIISDKV